ncbi:hypothetical protein BT63DRAFT_429180 [Microthyrium microscopicum]|uniref:Glycosylphosphatidylinositol anchor biosynthesis protein 11 n=1 Tax=Microthyrium microscopicum TaxID=703497 RepID=A0A6A6U2A0_9PEZI|nr:hypothetical protein BT63DRAFT_429180 [Microthyrium microscopicum]
MATATTPFPKVDIRPVSSLDSDASRLYTHIHPLLLLSTYLLQFKEIVADPESALASMLIPLVVLQLLYNVVCLPPVGSPTAKPSTTKSIGKKKPGGPVGAPISKRITTSLLASIVTILIGTPILTTLLILFGAPLTTHFRHTVLCAAHISLLAGLPLTYVHGIEMESWRRISALMLPIDEVFGAAVGTILGAWLGAIPIPLDWDREWQKWPVTIVTGAYIGWAVGKIAGRYLLHGKIIDLSG